LIPRDELVINVVATAVHGIRGRWREQYDGVDLSRARRLLQDWGVFELAERALGTLSDGECQRVMIARALMTDPEILILDEPATGLDVAAREHLVADLEWMARDKRGPCTITVTHHFEEIPKTASHAILLSEGHVVSLGPIRTVLTNESVSTAYGYRFRVVDADGRWMVMRA
jgi:iron complex transport system ATP-binding protein